MRQGLEVSDTGTKRWYQDDKLHREDGPAFEHVDGSKEWYRNGELHREDGPAIEYSDSSKMWQLDFNHPLADGLTITLAGGTKRWYQNGKQHREGGPAVEYVNGYKEWWFEGEKCSEEDPRVNYIKYNKLRQVLKPVAFEKL